MEGAVPCARPTPLVFTLRHEARKRLHNADEIMAELVVEQRWNDGYGAGSGPSPGNPCRRVSRPNLKFKLTHYPI